MDLEAAVVQFGLGGGILIVVFRIFVKLIDNWRTVEDTRTKSQRQVEDQRTDVLDKRLGELVDSHQEITSELVRIHGRLDTLEGRPSVRLVPKER
jgi:hypothetical protein